MPGASVRNRCSTAADPPARVGEREGFVTRIMRRPIIAVAVVAAAFAGGATSAEANKGRGGGTPPSARSTAMTEMT